MPNLFLVFKASLHNLKIFEWHPVDIGVDSGPVSLGIVSILDDCMPRNLRQMLTYSTSSGTTVPFMQLLKE